MVCDRMKGRLFVFCARAIFYLLFSLISFAAFVFFCFLHIYAVPTSLLSPGMGIRNQFSHAYTHHTSNPEKQKRMDKKQKGKGNGIHKNMQVASVVKSGQAQARDRRQSDSTQIAAAASRHQEVTRSRAAASTSHKCAYQLVKENDDAARSKDVNYSTLQSG